MSDFGTASALVACMLFSPGLGFVMPNSKIKANPTETISDTRYRFAEHSQLIANQTPYTLLEHYLKFYYGLEPIYFNPKLTSQQKNRNLLFLQFLY